MEKQLFAKIAANGFAVEQWHLDCMAKVPMWISARPRSRIRFALPGNKFVEQEHHFPVSQRMLINTSGTCEQRCACCTQLFFG